MNSENNNGIPGQEEQKPGTELTGQPAETTEVNTSKFVFSNESLKKQMRPSEFFAEKIITGVAFLSIAVIILIFLFVFRETLPIFSGKAAKKTELSTAKQETYGEAAAESSSGKQEVYGATDDTVVTTESQAGDSLPSYSGNESVTADQVTLKSLAGKTWMPVSENPRYGLLPLIIGTLKITLISILFAAPLAILAALFSAAFAPRWMREIIKPAIELLAGFPSVVIGFFALMVMATFFQHLFGYETRLNAFVGGVAMALAAIPIIFTVTEDVMTAVPSTYKEASLALGASKWQTAFFVTLPAAAPGIFAAVLLGIGRIFGETMIVLMATGNAAMMSLNPFESVRTLSATIGAEMAEVVFGDTHYNVLFLIGTLLFVFTFALNAIAEFYVKGKLMTRLQGKTS
ncbi:MAG: phosphate ABC transporter permease subunit PstC [Bacteroidetes bacterium]|nr:phosphate ABC transporter permease subunit PstC [Bacteroidota bacterium]